MKARPFRRHLLTAGLVTGLFGFVLGPATPASAAAGDLTVINNGAGHGTITGTGIDCSDLFGPFDCSAAGVLAPVTLTASTYSPHSWFGGWSVDPNAAIVSGCVGGHTCVVDPTAAGATVTGTFHTLGAFPGIGTLSVAKAGTGTGTVTSTDGLINCGADCGQSYGPVTSVTLNAIPGAGSSFAGWSISGPASILSGCGGTGACTLALNPNNWGYPGYPWDFYPWDAGFNWNNLVTATFNAAATTVTAAGPATEFTHVHQHGGRVTGKVHHGVFHAKKHVHTHTHAL